MKKVKEAQSLITAAVDDKGSAILGQLICFYAPTLPGPYNSIAMFVPCFCTVSLSQLQFLTQSYLYIYTLPPGGVLSKACWKQHVFLNEINLYHGSYL